MNEFLFEVLSICLQNEVEVINAVSNTHFCPGLIHFGCLLCSSRYQETWYWQSDATADDIVMSGVRCSGTELTLDQCLHHGKHIQCPKGGGRFAAGVACTLSKERSMRYYRIYCTLLCPNNQNWLNVVYVEKLLVLPIPLSSWCVLSSGP